MSHDLRHPPLRPSAGSLILEERLGSLGSLGVPETIDLDEGLELFTLRGSADPTLDPMGFHLGGWVR